MWIYYLLMTWWQWCLTLLSVFMPLGSLGQRAWKLSAAVRWTLHVLILAGVIVGLFFLNRWLNVPALVRAPWVQPWWLAILFLTFYFLVWIGWWIWKLLAFEAESSYFPDIDAAWKEILDTLGQAGIKLPESPVFLILGRPETKEKNLFDAARAQWTVPLTPADPRAPIHAIADRDAVYFTCQGASLLGRQARILALEEMSEGDGGEGGGGGDFNADATMKPGRKEKGVIDIIREIGGREGTTLERRKLRRLMGNPIGPDFIADPAEVERLSARLGHFCRLLARERLPFCPINGLLLLVPLGGTDTDADAQKTAEACTKDLDTLRRDLKLECPMFALVSDMEVLPGFKEHIARHNAADLRRRFGQRFPLATSIQGDALLDQLEDSLYYLSNTFVQDSVYKSFKTETADKPDSMPLFTTNGRLALLMDEMRQRSRRLVRILVQTVKRDTPGSLLFGGCYLGATGPKGEQAFVKGLFDRLTEEQNCVQWTPQAIEDDANAHRQTRLGYIILGVIVVAAVAFLAWPFIRNLIR